LNGITAHIHEALVPILEDCGTFNKCAAYCSDGTNHASHCAPNMEVTHHMDCILNFSVYHADNVCIYLTTIVKVNLIAIFLIQIKLYTNWRQFSKVFNPTYV
jgi:hypothetical protein